MKNEIYSINGIYDMVRNYYMDNFPHTVGFKAVDVINFYLHTFNKSAIVEKIEDDYVLNNPNPTKADNDPFTQGLVSINIKFETYLSHKNGMIKIFQDVNALHQWLTVSGFINDGIATEKMLSVKKL